jgi:hypothetical protein
VLKVEQETVISFNAAETTAAVYSSMKRMVTKLERNPAFVLEEKGVHEGTAWVRGTLPARLVSLRNGKVSVSGKVASELLCPKCGKTFTSKQGHANHIERDTCVAKEDS